MVASAGAAIGLIAALVGIVSAIGGATYQLRRDRRTDAAEPANLQVGSWDVGPVRPEKRQCELRFVVVNGGRRGVVLDELLVEVLASRPSASVRRLDVRAPVDVHEHRVELRPGPQVHDLRRRAFAPDVPPLAVPGGGGEAFVVALLSAQPQEYELQVVCGWHDTATPAERRELRSDVLVVDFPRATTES